MADGYDEPSLLETQPVGDRTEDQPDSRSPLEKGVEIELDWEALAVAFENQLPQSHSFLDLTSGTVTTISGSASIPEPPEPADNFLYIQPRPSREGYRTMQNFAETIEDAFLRERLTAALVGKGAFRRFKDQLLDFPRVRQEWFAHKDAEVYSYVRSWLENQGVKATNQPPPTTSKDKLPMPAARSSQRDFSATINLQDSGADFLQAIADYDRPGLIFRPRRTALLVIDMQKIFIDPQGDSFLPLSVEVGKRLAQVIESCRRAFVPVIYTRHVHHDPSRDGGAMSRWWRSLITEGSDGAEIVDQLKPLESETVITKCRYSAFTGTRLEMILRSYKIEDLIIGGVMTNLCCETTAREAFVRDFNIFFLGDGTAAANSELHMASLQNIAYGFGRVLATAEAVELLERSAE
ncbi:MAG: isochorismatase family protein [Deltaproteobacteria bacterium]|nr:isochorismatase family protein [Deltaproteobacteria bacterium]